MKKYLLFIKTLSLALLLFCLTGCEKDHACEGNISVRFYELAESIKIYPVTGNVNNVCIYESKLPTTLFEITLNSGNYIIVCSIKGSKGTYDSTEKGFQIRDGKTTSLHLNSERQWIVE